jgi:hypothetical protein
LGDIGEFEISVLVVQRDQPVAALAEMFDGRAVHDNNVELAIILAIDQPHSAAHGLADVLLVGSGNMRSGDSGLARDFSKMKRLSERCS